MAGRMKKSREQRLAAVPNLLPMFTELEQNVTTRRRERNVGESQVNIWRRNIKYLNLAHSDGMNDCLDNAGKEAMNLKTQQRSYP